MTEVNHAAVLFGLDLAGDYLGRVRQLYYNNLQMVPPTFNGFRAEAPPPPARDCAVEDFLGRKRDWPPWWKSGNDAVRHLVHTGMHLDEQERRLAQRDDVLAAYFRLRQVRGFHHVHAATEMMEFDVSSYGRGADARMGVMFFPATMEGDKFNYGGFVAKLGPLNNFFMVAFEDGEVLYLDPTGTASEAAARLELFAREMQSKMEEELTARGVDPSCNDRSPRNAALAAHPNCSQRSFLRERKELALLKQGNPNYQYRSGYLPTATFCIADFFCLSSEPSRSCVKVIPPTFVNGRNGGLLLGGDGVGGFRFFYFWSESGHWESLARKPKNDNYLEFARGVITDWMRTRTCTRWYRRRGPRKGEKLRLELLP